MKPGDVPRKKATHAFIRKWRFKHRTAAESLWGSRWAAV